MSSIEQIISTFITKNNEYKIQVVEPSETSFSYLFFLYIIILIFLHCLQIFVKNVTAWAGEIY